MFFCKWFKKKKEKLTVWSVIPDLEKTGVGPVPAKKFIPEWFKTMQKDRGTNPSNYNLSGSQNFNNIKHCPSFPWWFAQGYVLPLWCDLQIYVQNEKVYWTSPTQEFQFEFHSKDQFEHHIPKHASENILAVLKPAGPFRFKTPLGWQLQQIPMFFEFNTVFEVLPGIIPSSKYFEVNPQLLLKKSAFTEENNYSVIIPKGTPLAMYVPVPEDSLELDLVEETPELKKENRIATLALNTKFKKRWKDYEKQCPIKK